MKELKDTIDLMVSEDYKERFLAELYQLEIRISKLEKLIKDYRSNSLKFKPTTNIGTLEEQLRARL